MRRRAGVFFLVLVCCAGFVLPARGQSTTISFSQVASASPQSPTATVNVTYPGAQTAGDMNIVVVGWNDTTATVQSVKDSTGNAYSLAIGPTSGTGLRQSIYYAPNIKGGNNTVTVTFSQAAVYPDVRILEYRGVTSVDVTSGASGNSASTSSGAATTKIANELIFGANMVATQTGAPGSGFTSRIVTSPDGDNAEDKIVTAAGSYSATATLTSAGPWVMQMVTFAAAPIGNPQLALSASSLSFGSVAVGSSSSQALTLTSTGTAPVTVNAVSVNGAAFKVAAGTLPATLNPNQSLTLSVTFTPTSGGTASGQLTVTSNSSTGSSAAVSLSGTGTTVTNSVPISFAQVASATPQSPTATVAVTYPAAQTSGDMNIVVVGWNDTTSTVQSVKDSSGNAYSLAIGPTSGTGLRQSIYYAPNITGGTNTVTVTFNQAAAYPDVRILEYSGVAAVDVTAGASGNSASASSGAATTRIANELIFGANTVATQTGAPGSGFTSRIVTSPDGDNAEDKIVTAAGSNSATATLTSAGHWVMQMVTFAAGSVPAPTGSPQLALSAGSLSFGSVAVGSSSSQTLTLTSTGTAPVTVNTVSESGAAFKVVAGTLPMTLNPNQSLTLSVTFTPTAAGSASGQLTVTSNSSTGSSAAVSLSGTGTSSNPQLTLSATSLSFGSVAVNSSGTQSLTVTSSGTSALTINSASIAGSGFSLVGGSFPMTLNPGQSATLQVKFAPTAAGSDTGTLALSNNSSSGTASVALSGTGTSTSHQVNLTWAAPSSSPDPVAGYNIYRVVGSATAQRMNSAVNTQTTYADTSVVSGTTYAYYVTSVDSSGVESTPSNEVSVTIP